MNVPMLGNLLIDFRFIKWDNDNTYKRFIYEKDICHMETQENIKTAVFSVYNHPDVDAQYSQDKLTIIIANRLSDIPRAVNGNPRSCVFDISVETIAEAVKKGFAQTRTNCGICAAFKPEFLIFYLGNNEIIDIEQLKL